MGVSPSTWMGSKSSRQDPTCSDMTVRTASFNCSTFPTNPYLTLGRDCCILRDEEFSRVEMSTLSKTTGGGLGTQAPPVFVLQVLLPWATKHALWAQQDSGYISKSPVYLPQLYKGWPGLVFLLTPGYFLFIFNLGFIQWNEKWWDSTDWWETQSRGGCEYSRASRKPTLSWTRADLIA